MITTLENRNILKKNHNGDLYSVPETMLNAFSCLNEDIQNANTLSDEWFAAQDEFDGIFQQYLIEN